MKTVLIAAHQISFSDPESLYNCLGVLTLSACLKKRNLECEVLDLFEYNNLYSLDCNQILDSIAAKILASEPDILGFSTMLNNLPVALELANRIKRLRPRIFIVFGGPGTAYCARNVLINFKQVDVIFRGEADIVFPDFVESIRRGGIEGADYSLPGMIYRAVSGQEDIADNGWPEPVQNLNELPVPDYKFKSESFFSQTRTSFGDYNGISVETGRGCPFTCSFCSTSIYFKRKYRLKSVSRVIEEILLIKERLGSARIIFNHDLFTLNRKYVFEMCDQIKIRVPGMIWKCHARLDTLDEEILSKMNDAGCNEIFVGLESATEKMQKIIQKKLDLDKFDLLLDFSSSLDMKFSLSFIVGFPEEDENDIREIFSYCLKAKYLCRDHVQVKIHSLVPLVGSPLYEKWKGKLVYDDYGSIGTTDIPYSWKPLREIIKLHPEIFSLYFYLPLGGNKRNKSLKYGYLGLMIEKLMVHSILLAWEFLGERLSGILVNNIDKINLPPASSLKNSEYQILAESVRNVINESLKENPIGQKMYDSMARYEIALLESFVDTSEDFCKIIEVFYNPEDLMEQIRNKKFILETGTINPSCGGKKRYYMIFKDKNENKMKNSEIPSDFAELIKLN